MTDSTAHPSGPVVVTGANGLVGSRVCRVLAARGLTVRAVVRRAGTAPSVPGVREWVGEFHDPEVAAAVTGGAGAVVSTVHPMGSDLDTQRRIGVEGTRTLALAARDAGVGRFVHVSTAAVYDRSPGVEAVTEAGVVVDEDGGDYPVTKRDTDAAVAEIDGLTAVLLRPPAILGAAESSVWNVLRPAAFRDDEQARHAVADGTFAWVHVDDLTSLAADLADGTVVASSDPERGPVEGRATPVNVAAGSAGDRATQRDYYETLGRALDLEPVWDDAPAWTGHIAADRARAWGWSPSVDLRAALAEIEDGLRA
ncbi:NAD(P)H-binding protein [Nocardioides sp.]|uniref:NAD-dependent epimerase/dehydratase family protein n=1 Tax=Nocardioides sp. TaxID=35761 RepID=UPI0026183B32|nr:NAD(P)H-binding protein [Nocardioides sp.]